MSRSTLLIAVGGALGGSGVMLAMLAVVFQPLLIFLAVPLAAAGFLIWFQGTGRLEARMRRQARRRDREATRQRAQPDGDEGPRWTDREFRQRRRRAREQAREAAQGGPFESGRRRRRGGRTEGGRSASVDAPSVGGMSTEEAYRTLELDPDAEPDAVRDAYRSKVKEVHPDTDGGDEERFKQVNEAYETLQERVL